jgi:hypothetical protein
MPVVDAGIVSSLLPSMLISESCSDSNGGGWRKLKVAGWKWLVWVLYPTTSFYVMVSWEVQRLVELVLDSYHLDSRLATTMHTDFD